ncbi:hypothetical protein KGM_215884 [Danaus plexippus plexippus]|uniref:Uncharacterized protein n=1 Tax=Danaus plexippus plexippus TaxID=278856 RepID=A0A212EP72_DANPL|nr:hypothetical protein KGM_215884 [Danaus plexippus plexippus]
MLSLSPRSQAFKREHENEDQNFKRAKSENDHSLETKAFIKACALVTQNAHEDLPNRFQIVQLPICIKNCKHNGSKTQILQIAPHAEEIFMVEFRSHKWYEALEICFLSISETSYLSENVLKNIIEIMMNAHEDHSSNYEIMHLVGKCQQVLSMNIRIHPPCSFEPIRKCYLNFLTTPMDLRQNTQTNRNNFGSKDGIFQYCINRLESELRADSKNEPLFDKEKYIPVEIKQTIQGVHWEKSRLETFEMLKRTDRIDRLMAVMDSLTELIGFDLAFYHSRLLKREVSMRRQKILITKILNLDDLKNDEMNEPCKQIIRIYIYFIHLSYPEKYVKIMNFWINTLVETLYSSEKQMFDFHNIGRKCRNFALTFHRIMSELPPASIVKILETLTPTRMRYFIGMLHCEVLLSVTIKSSIIRTLINFVKESQWNHFPESQNSIIPEGVENAKQLTADNILRHLIKISKNENKSCDNNNVRYPKFKHVNKTFVTDQIFVTRVLYITVQAYLDAYHLCKMEKTLKRLTNESLQDNSKVGVKYFESVNSFVTQASVKIYRSIYSDLKEFIQDIKKQKEIPKILDIFMNIIDLKEL